LGKNGHENRSGKKGHPRAGGGEQKRGEPGGPRDVEVKPGVLANTPRGKRKRGVRTKKMYQKNRGSLLVGRED